jgi:3-hydroxyisobutyrate dehydrogenase
MDTVGVIGLGQMGSAMVETLVREGFRVVGTDLDDARRKIAEGHGAETVDTIAEVCAETDMVVLSLPEAHHVEAVVSGPGGVLEQNRPGVMVMDATTSEPEMSRKLSGLMAEAGHGFLDTPVSGGPQGARAGTLAVMVGGEEADFERARPVLEALAGKLSLIGPSGSGNVVKLINNLMAAAHFVVAGEAALLAERAGVDPARLFEVASSGSGRSFATEVAMPNFVLTGTRDFGFAAALMRKDVRLAMALADATGTETRMAALTGQIWAASADELEADADFTEIPYQIIQKGKA